ncbi:hypothetical protein [Parafilimonas sp.]|uniref:hypothetical protein n=1 Tax=Parafilimonas sp. TaxID=1969739 RepID=UPI003F7D7852
MASEHNPIAGLIHQIQQKWIDEVSPCPQIKIARWLIQPDQARLFEGFLKLESTEHGALPEVLVTMLTPFKNERTYAFNLIKDWIDIYESDEKTQQKLTAAQKTTDWNAKSFLAEKAEHNNTDQTDQLIKMLTAFHAKMIGNNMRLVVALFPYSIHDMEGLKRWLASLLKKDIPDSITFMLFDHIGEYFFDNVFTRFPDVTKSLHINLDLDGAISKITKMGDPNSPEIQFRECMLEMGKAVQHKDITQLNKWGEKGLTVTQRSGIKSMFATAHIIYAGMLFNFKVHDKIDALLSSGLTIAKQGLQTEAATCRPLIIQFYGYTGASKQAQKKMKEAITAYEKQGDLAMEYQLAAMALTPYWQAYNLSKKNEPLRYKELLKKAYSIKNFMQKEELENSSFAVIAYDYAKWLEDNQQWEEAKQTDNEFKTIYGDDWREQVKKPGASSIKMRESFVVQ